MGVEAKLKELGLELPPTPRHAANYVGAVQTSNLLFISGHGPMKDGPAPRRGRQGKGILAASIDLSTTSGAPQQWVSSRRSCDVRHL
jgi:hypothetical protein